MRPLCSPRPALRIRPCGRVREGAGSDHLDEYWEVEEGGVDDYFGPLVEPDRPILSAPIDVEPQNPLGEQLQTNM